MTGTPLVVTLGPQDAGALLGQSANWMLEKARAGTIPCTRLGRKIRFTPHHVAEIARMFEQKPRRPALPARAPARRAAADGVPVLEARTPRRKQHAA
jgi:hypothetical protein